MFVIRRAKMDDQSTLLKLAKMVHFINLPADKDIIAQKISASRQSFGRVGKGEPARTGEHFSDLSGGLSDSIAHTDLYMFVLDDESNPGCLGTSQLVAQMGGPHDPNLCFKLEKREKYSESLKVGTSNVVARVFEDASGPTEIGGLILQQSLRGHPARLGRLLSLVRFHFIGRFRSRFRDQVLAEMMAPITADGHNTLWDYLGRRFIPLSYTEADRFCQYSREFIRSLMPEGDIHLSLLPPEAREVIGRVGTDTIPARKMLEKLGFVYDNLVDPFDGGPFLKAKTDEISIVRDTRNTTVGEPKADAARTERCIVSVLRPDGSFIAIEEAIGIGADGTAILSRAAMDTLRVMPGDEVGYTPMPVRTKKPGTAAAPETTEATS
ncbi:MAG: arginine N-succinyltransferase [Phycisphaeraceae bacterium]|nr:MAG: arginine N-succinyltransferase [Phycisphaeraceae bacterium]